jgi:hypothetical protein
MGKSAEYPFPQGEYSELEAVRKGQNSEFYPKEENGNLVITG